MDKKLKFIFFTLLALFGYYANAQEVCPIIPLPTQYKQEAGQLDFGTINKISVNHEDLLPVAHYFQKELLAKTGQTILLQQGPAAVQMVSLILTPKSKAKGYTLVVTPVDVKISAATPEEVFNGINSLLQLVRLGNNGKIACWNIADKPSMQWRGLMLDEARHFFGKETVKQLLDWMAFYKLNRFHWHLTDRQGWRLEIKKYPALALVGGIGNHTDSLARPSFYTQQDISEIVKYAQERYIEIIPEIDMPGHATAANRAYPKYSADGPDSPPGFTFNPGMEETYSYLTQILKEVKVLFPSNMIHMGGDEVHFGNKKWAANKHVQQLMSREKLKNVKEVEQYFNRRMADSIYKMDAKVLGWDEIVGSGIADKKNTIVFWWRANETKSFKQALDEGYQVVICPNIPFYFDYNQDMTHIAGRRSGQLANTSEAIYNFSLNKFSDFINENNRHLIMGMQANIWTERIRSKDRLEYVLFPRIAALAETAWASDTAGKDYTEFKKRLNGHLALYQQLGMKFYNPSQPAHTPEVVDLLPKVKK